MSLLPKVSSLRRALVGSGHVPGVSSRLSRALSSKTQLNESQNASGLVLDQNNEDGHPIGGLGEGPESTHFGFRVVPKQEKQKMVADVFHGVADRYDLMNDLMSGTMHRFWKDEFVRMLGPAPNKAGPKLKILDVAGGTGDIAFRIIDALKQNGWRPSVASEREDGEEGEDVVVCDINESMLAVGRERAQRQGIGQGAAPRLSWVQGNAEELPFESESFDAYTIAFGIRNVTNIEKALSEAHRVLRRGGRFMCLEFSHLENPLLQQFYDQYSFSVIPALGQFVANDRDSYQYLVESIRQFPPQEEFKAMIERAGFKLVRYHNFTFGVVAVHSGFKL